MSLKTSFGTFNKDTQTGLCICYSTSEENGLFVVTRYASKTYSYVGMTFAAANKCAAAKRAQYLRKHNVASVVVNTDSEASETSYKIRNSEVYESLCSISVVHGDGDSWDVEIQVNEEESRGTDSSSTSPESLFSAENAWDYDEGESSSSETAYKITAASGTSGETSITTTIETNDESFSPGGAILAVAAGTSSDTYTRKSSSKSGSVWTVVWGGTLALTAEETSVKVVYGAAASNTMSFTPAEG